VVAVYFFFFEAEVAFFFPVDAVDFLAAIFRPTVLRPGAAVASGSATHSGEASCA